MKKLVLCCFTFILSAGVADAKCYGSKGNKVCYSNNGNTHYVVKSGNYTQVSSSNSRTGARWNSNYSTYGNTTYATGRSKKGNAWNETMVRQPSGYTHYYGTNSRGQKFDSLSGSKPCRKKNGCY